MRAGTVIAMHAIAVKRGTGLGPTRPRWRRSEHSCPRDNRPENRPYRLTMTMSEDLIRVRFAAFVDRALTQARARGMTDRDIHQATGIQASTFHRWRRGELRTTPDMGKVRAFCRGVGVDIGEALTALGMTGERTNPEPEPQMDPDIRLILRQLNDPNTPQAEKIFIHESLKMLAERASRRRKDETG